MEEPNSKKYSYMEIELLKSTIGDKKNEDQFDIIAMCAGMLQEKGMTSEDLKNILDEKSIKKLNNILKAEGQSLEGIFGEEKKENAMTVTNKTNIFSKALEKVKDFLIKARDTVQNVFKFDKEAKITPVKKDEWVIPETVEQQENGSEGKREEVKEGQDKKRDEGTFAEKYHVDVPGISQERLEELQRESKEQDKEEESARG